MAKSYPVRLREQLYYELKELSKELSEELTIPVTLPAAIEYLINHYQQLRGTPDGKAAAGPEQHTGTAERSNY